MLCGIFLYLFLITKLHNINIVITENMFQAYEKQQKEYSQTYKS
jgi:hypothetical protein